MKSNRVEFFFLDLDLVCQVYQSLKHPPFNSFHQMKPMYMNINQKFLTQKQQKKGCVSK